MRVMIGVDDSPCSQAALEFVRRVSWPSDTTMVVVSAVELPAAAYATEYAPANLELGAWLDELTKYHQEVVSRDETMLRSAIWSWWGRMGGPGWTGC
jgi:predicted membrane-bound dolichyl-phosphate-mannose-protein mannosyltransferase